MLILEMDQRVLIIFEDLSITTAIYFNRHMLQPPYVQVRVTVQLEP
jgi:hypothetical protein